MEAKTNTPVSPVAAKAKRVLKAPSTKTVTKSAKPTTKAAPKAKVERVAKPTVAVHNFDCAWTQPSGPLNARPSKTPIDFGKFGTHADAALTDRDRKSLAAIRTAFKQGQFARANVDAGILRRLGERGLLAHVSGSDVAADAMFQLTPRAFSKEAMAS